MRINKNRYLIILLSLLMLINTFSFVIADSNLDIDYIQDGNEVKVNIKGDRNRPVSMTIKDESRYYYIDQGFTDDTGNASFNTILNKGETYNCKVNIDGNIADKNIIMEVDSDPGTDPDPDKKNIASLYIKGYTEVILNKSDIDIMSGESVLDFTTRLLDANKIDYKIRSGYISSIDGQAEFDKGSGSGWMFSVNGKYPNVGAEVIKVKSEDNIEWLYTYDLGEDIGGSASSSNQPTIDVEGIKNNETFKASKVTFKVNAKSTQSSIRGERADVTVKLNGKTIISKNDTYTIILEKGENILEIRAIDSKRNRRDVTYNLIYKAPEKELGEPEQLDDVIKKLYKDGGSISSWAYKDVNKATLKGFVNGIDGNFMPKKNITRAEFTKIVVNILGLDINTSKELKFDDVNSNDWFYPYVNAAFKAGIVKGDASNFNPNESLTREQMAVIISRGLNLEYQKSDTEIKDLDKVSSWAKEDVETVVALELMLGNEGKFDPKSHATREMAMVVAMRGYEAKSDNVKESVEEDVRYLNIEEQIQNTAKFLQRSVKNPEISSVGGEWIILGLSRSGIEVAQDYYDNYYKNVENTLKEKQGELHRVKYTEYDRVILALTSIGKDVKNVAGYDLIKPLADFNTLIKQGINGPIFALIALDSKDYEIPIEKSIRVQTTRDMLVDLIIGREIKGGGWALDKDANYSEPDTTAMAIQGLTPYYSTNSDVKVAVDRAIKWLSDSQGKDGGYSTWDAVNSESIAQVIVALTGMGIDPYNDERFIKNENSLMSALLDFSADEGGFYHLKVGEKGRGGLKPGEVDIMATEQAMYALSAYNRFINGENRLYDMTDVK